MDDPRSRGAYLGYVDVGAREAVEGGEGGRHVDAVLESGADPWVVSKLGFWFFLITFCDGFFSRMGENGCGTIRDGGNIHC